MSQSSSQSRKRSHASSSTKSSTTTKTSNTSPYNADFLQKMIDNGVYPDGYEDFGDDPPEPENIEVIRQALAEPRGSLSPSRFSDSEFKRFKKKNRRAKSEAQAAADVIPYITGSKDRQYETTGNVEFNNLAKFDPNVTTPKPDGYYGVKPADIDLRVRNDLDKYITPSTSKHYPAAPNFFREDKGAKGRADVAQNQAMYAGAIGARAMWHLQNYGNTTPVYDGNAYTISSTYHPGTGTLQMYATHPVPSATAGCDPQYYMTQLNGYYMIGTSGGYRAGVAAYRNAREWTREKRDQHIAEANAMAQRLSTETRSLDTSGNDASTSPLVDEAFSSETSADELSLEYEATIKRQRRRVSTR